jgi:hypothetical protein
MRQDELIIVSVWEGHIEIDGLFLQFASPSNNVTEPTGES